MKSLTSVHVGIYTILLYGFILLFYFDVIRLASFKKIADKDNIHCDTVFLPVCLCYHQHPICLAGDNLLLG